jgi:alanine racemase
MSTPRKYGQCQECGKPLTDADAYGHDCEPVAAAMKRIKAGAFGGQSVVL